MDGFTFREIATFTCDEGFTLEGDPTRTCQASENWSEENPLCLSKLGDNHIISCLLLLGYPVLHYAYILCHAWLKLMGGTRSI